MKEELWVHFWQEQEIFSSPKHPDQLRDPPSLFSGYPHSFLWDVKLSNSLNIVLRLKMRGISLCFPSCLHGVYRDFIISFNNDSNISLAI